MDNMPLLFPCTVHPFFGICSLHLHVSAATAITPSPLTSVWVAFLDCDFVILVYSLSHFNVGTLHEQGSKSLYNSIIAALEPITIFAKNQTLRYLSFE